MRCKQVHTLSSAYLDGELDPARSSALRGHLRSCDACAERLADERAIVRASREVEPIDPPAHLWNQISERLAEAEVADAERSPLRLRVSGLLAALRPFRAHIAVGVAVAVLATITVTKRGFEQPIARGVSLSDMDANAKSAIVIADLGAAVFAPTATSDETHLEAAFREIREADERYLTAIADLRELADAERPSWSSGQERHYDSAVAAFEARAEKLLAESGQTTDSRRRGPLYQHYRDHIAFLEGALFGDVEGGAR